MERRQETGEPCTADGQAHYCDMCVRHKRLSVLLPSEQMISSFLEKEKFHEQRCPHNVFHNAITPNTRSFKCLTLEGGSNRWASEDNGIVVE